MQDLFENISVTATQEWSKYFSGLIPVGQPASAGKIELILCTSAEIASVVNSRLEIPSVYVVYPNHSWMDVRYVAELYLLPVLEPAEAEDFWLMLRLALIVSKTRNISVILITHDNFSFLIPEKKSSDQALIDYFMENIILPENYAHLDPIEKMAALEKFAASSPLNSLIAGDDKTLGIIACGNIGNMLEKLPRLAYPILKLRHYPLGRELAEQLYYNCDEILVLEHGLPYIEQHLRGIMGIGTRIRGKINRIVPRNEKISLSMISDILNL